MQEGNVIVVGSNGVIGYHNIEKSNSPCITVGRSGSVGKVHYYDQPAWAHNTALYIKDFKGNYPQYLYYFLKNLHLDNLFWKNNSVVPSLDRKVVHGMFVPFHDDYETQKRIASILSNLDRKIALNRKINANLEALARQLYDYWFVQFDFPDANGKPHKSSGGKMVYNTQLKREIPEGWENSQMDDMCIMYQPQTLGLNDLAKGGEYLVYGANGTIGNYHAYNHEKSEIAMACRGSSCGTLNRTMPQSWITGNAMVIKLKDEKIHNEYIYHALSYVNISGAITGSGQPQLTRTNIEKLSILKPAKDILLLFSKRVEPIVDLQIKIRTEILSLTRQRDELLPLLMNGQVTIE